MRLITTMPPAAEPLKGLFGLGEATKISPIWGAISLASGAASAYHGVKRNNGSAWQGVKWFVLGSFFPIVTPAIAVAQGFGKPKSSTPTAGSRR